MLVMIKKQQPVRTHSVSLLMGLWGHRVHDVRLNVIADWYVIVDWYVIADWSMSMFYSAIMPYLLLLLLY